VHSSLLAVGLPKKRAIKRLYPAKDSMKISMISKDTETRKRKITANSFLFGYYINKKTP